MRHARNDTTAYHLWVEARPSFNGKGKEAYYRAVQQAARAVIQAPITASDIEVEITYSTAIAPSERMDADNIQKPTLDALSGVAYEDDRQVRHAQATVFDRAALDEVKGRVEHLGRLFYTPHPHVVLIRIYSDTRLAEIGGARAVQQKRYEEFERHFDTALRDLAVNTASGTEDEFVQSAGVYRDPSTGYYVCPRCRSDRKRSLLVEGERGFSCPVCSGYFPDHDREAKAGQIAGVRRFHRRPGGWASR